MPGTKFTATVQAVTSGLAQTSAPVYEKALASLGRLTGAAARPPGDDAEPDSVWLFGQELWIGFEAKDRMQAVRRSLCGHRPGDRRLYQLAAASAGITASVGSFVVIVSPQQDVHRAAAAVVGDRVYLVPPEMISDIAGRLAGAWDSIWSRPGPSGRPRPNGDNADPARQAGASQPVAARPDSAPHS